MNLNLDYLNIKNYNDIVRNSWLPNKFIVFIYLLGEEIYSY